MALWSILEGTWPMWIHVGHARTIEGKCPEANGDLHKNHLCDPLRAPDTFIHDEQTIGNKHSRTFADKGLLQFQWNWVLAHKCSAGSHQLAVRVQLLEDQAHLLIHVALAEAAAAVVAIETVTTVVAKIEV